MKKLICLILSAVFIIGAVAPAVSAAQEDKIYFDDGSYLLVYDSFPPRDEESISGFLNRIIEFIKSIINMLKTTKTVTKVKYVNYCSSKDEVLWSVRLEGEFTYNGRTAVCTASELFCEIYDSDWKLMSSSHGEKENTATGEFVMKQYKLGVPLKEISRVLTLTCDKNGNVK